jgi:hypothetical protein
MTASIRNAVAAAILLLATTSPGLAQDAPDEEAAVRAALEHYLLGHATGDGAHYEMVFHPQSKLFWMRDDTLNTRTSADYIAGASGSPAADED